MTPAELAALLHGRQYQRGHVTKADEAMAKAHGLVIIYGESDDLMEFRGAIDEELGAWEGKTAHIHAGGVLADHEERCECAFCGYDDAKARCAVVEALWCEGEEPEYSWTFKTDIPHATFDIMEDADKFCRGIVLRVADLPSLKVNP